MPASQTAHPEEFTIPLRTGASVSARWYRAAPSGSSAAAGATPRTIILAHGAGAGQSHPFMVTCGRDLSSRGLHIVTFNFPYMEAKKHAPDRAPVLEAAFLDVIDVVRGRRALAGSPIVLGGKSMGGRMASHVAAQHAERAGAIAGLVFLGYPLHPPGRPDQVRDAHLPLIREPMLFVQGSRDGFGTPAELQPVLARLTAPAELLTIEGGDHSFAVSKAKSDPGRQARVYADIFDHVTRWVTALPVGTDAR